MLSTQVTDYFLYSEKNYVYKNTVKDHVTCEKRLKQIVTVQPVITKLLSLLEARDPCFFVVFFNSACRQTSLQWCKIRQRNAHLSLQTNQMIMYNGQ